MEIVLLFFLVLFLNALRAGRSGSARRDDLLIGAGSAVVAVALLSHRFA